jgi:hypothetical protein
MVDIVITPANVIAGGNSTRDSGIAGEALLAGKTVFLNTTTNKWMLSDNNGSGTRSVGGIALVGASLNQPVTFIKSGDLALGATLVAGTAYYLSGTPGGICPVADLVTGMDPVLIGIATSTTNINVSIQDVGVTL